MKTAIIILNYNDYPTTKDMLEKIKDYNSIDYIVVVDNKSIDDSYQKLKVLENSKIKVIQTDCNKGYSYGNNYGLKYLENKNINYVIISNPDVDFEEEVISQMKDDLKDDKITLVAPIINQKGEKLGGWKLPHFKEDLISNTIYFHRYANKLLKYDDSYYQKNLVQVDVVSGCFFMINYQRFKEINFFDTNTFLYYEENILSSKLKKYNYRSYIDTRILVNHNLSVSVDKSINKLKKYKLLKDSQMYYEKKYNNINIFQLFLLRLFYYITLIISYIVLLFRRS